MTRILHSTALLALLGALSVVSAGLDPSGPNLRFNWTLQLTDAPVRMSPLPWRMHAGGNGADVSSGTQGYSLYVDPYTGDGLAFNGRSADAWGKTNPTPATTVYMNNDPGFGDPKTLTAPASPDIVYSYAANRFKKYDNTLTLGEGTWTFDNVTIMTGMQTDAPSLDAVRKHTVPFIANGSVNPFYTFTGRWERTAPSAGAWTQLPERATCYDDAVVTTRIPRNTAYVVLRGTRGPASRDFQIYFSSATEQYADISIMWTKLEQSTSALMYMLPLDPKVAYNMTLTCVSGTSGENAFESVDFYSAVTKGTFEEDVAAAGSPGSGTSGTGTSGSSGTTGTTGGTGPSSSGAASPGSKEGFKMPIGAIVALVLGVTLVVSVCSWGMAKQRRKRREHAASMSYAQHHRNDFVVDEEITPYGPPPPRPQFIPMKDSSPNVPTVSPQPAMGYAPVPQLGYAQTGTGQVEPPRAEDGGTFMQQQPPLYDPNWAAGPSAPQPQSHTWK